MKTRNCQFTLSSSRIQIEGLKGEESLGSHNLLRTTLPSGRIINAHDLELAAKDLVEANPILSAHLSQNKDGHLIATAEQHQNLVTVLATPAEIPNPPVDEAGAGQEVIRYLTEVISPLIPRLQSCRAQLREGLPIFRVDIITLPNDFLYFSLQLSHGIGDGTTYYQLLAQFHSLIEKGNIGSVINWDHEGHVIMRQKISLIKLRRMLYMVIIAIMDMIFHRPVQEPPKVMLLSREKIAREKERLEICCATKRETGMHLSTNDVIVMAICEAVAHYFPVMGQMVDFRQPRIEACAKNFGGNMADLVLLDSKACATNPFAVREVSNDTTKAPYAFSNKGKFPFWKLARTAGRGTAITNWASCLPKNTTNKLRAVAHLPHAEFLRPRAAIFLVFALNESTLGVIHNNLPHELQDSSGILGKIKL